MQELCRLHSLSDDKRPRCLESCPLRQETRLPVSYELSSRTSSQDLMSILFRKPESEMRGVVPTRHHGRFDTSNNSHRRTDLESAFQVSTWRLMSFQSQ